MNPNSPFFILGNPRSGTSLLRILISGHPALMVPPECGFLVWLYPMFRDFSGETSQMEHFVDSLIKTRKFETWGLPRKKLLSYLSKHRPVDYAQLVDCVYRLYAKQQGHNILYWGDKNNWYIDHVSILNEIFPEAKYIHIIRDGRDVACSYIELANRKKASVYAPKLPTDPTKIAQEWTANNRNIRKQLDGLPAISVSYEEIVGKPKETLNRVFGFLGVTPLDEFDHRAHTNHNDEPLSFLAWKEKLRQPVNPTSIGRFQRDLSEQEIAIFEKTCGGSLEEFGYRHVSIGSRGFPKNSSPKLKSGQHRC